MIASYRAPAWKEIEMTDEGFGMGVFSGKWGICKCKVEITEGPEGLLPLLHIDFQITTV
jgi:hypothetical protein